jgi:hypothetical protein
MRPLALVFFSVALALCNLSCSVNILSTFADKDTDEALYHDADTDLKNHDWNSALEKIGKMSTAYQATPLVLRQKGSAYGGLCGFIFFDFIQKLSGMGSARLFPFLLASFDAAQAANIDYCVLAQNTFLSIGSISERSTDDNFEIAMLAFAKIGNILSYYADPTMTGAAAGTFDACAVGTTRTNPGQQITDADAREIGTGISIAAANLNAVAGRINAGSSQLSSITSVCSALGGSDFCATTDPSAFTPTEVLGIRTLVKESSAIGLGSNCTGDVSVCHCP